MLLAIAAYTVLWCTRAPFLPSAWPARLGTGLAIVVGAAVLGKVLGFAFARVLLEHTLGQLQRLVSKRANHLENGEISWEKPATR